MKNLPILVLVTISCTVSLSLGSPIRNREYMLGNQRTSKSDSIAPEKSKYLYQNETLLVYSQVGPNSSSARLRQNQDKDNVYILVVSVPETTTARAPIIEPSVSPVIITNVNVGDIPSQVFEEAKPSSPAKAPAPTSAPNLINLIGNIIVHSLTGNASAIVDQSFGSGASTPLVTVLNNLLGDPSCNTIRRLLGQCRTPDDNRNKPEETQALLLRVDSLN